VANAIVWSVVLHSQSSLGFIKKKIFCTLFQWVTISLKYFLMLKIQFIGKMLEYFLKIKNYYQMFYEELYLFILFNLLSILFAYFYTWKLLFNINGLALILLFNNFIKWEEKK